MYRDSFGIVCTLAAFCLLEKVFSFSVTENDEAVKNVELYFYSPYSGEEIALSDTPFLFEYDNSLPLKIIIHGWMGDRLHATVFPIKNAYLASGTANVIVVDWSSGSKQNYMSARYLVKPIGDQIGMMLQDFFETRQLNSSAVHLIGHSLGAHIAGNVGRFFNGTIGRITGLDPAGPLFRETSADALSSDNALFVDSVHTSSGVLGQMYPIVDASFYPNRGYPPQPGCTALDFFLLGRCSHQRSAHYYAESIYMPYSFMSLKCHMDEILNELEPCQPITSGTAKIAYMGEALARNTRGTYYLETNGASPYGKKGQYD